METDTLEMFITESRKSIAPLVGVTSVDVAVKTLKGKLILVDFIHCELLLTFS